jgi:general stress protein 26
MQKVENLRRKESMYIYFSYNDPMEREQTLGLKVHCHIKLFLKKQLIDPEVWTPWVLKR